MAVVIWTPIMLLLAGFIVDMGGLISSREHVSDVAEQAARRVADDLDSGSLRHNPPWLVVNVGAAGDCKADAQDYLANAGEPATTTIVSCVVTNNPVAPAAANTANQPQPLPVVTVTVRMPFNPVFVSVVSSGANTVQGTGTASPVPGG